MQYTRDVQRYVEGLVQEGKYREALAVYRQLFQEAEPDGRACYGMGYCHYKLGNYVECREALDKANVKGYPAAVQMLQQISIKLHDKVGPVDEDEDFEESLRAAPPPLKIALGIPEKAPTPESEGLPGLPGDQRFLPSAWDTSVRYGGLAVAGTILLASGLPFFSVSIPSLSEAGDPLVRAAYCGLERSPLSALLAIVPVGLAIGTGLASLNRSRETRGMILLALATTVVSLAAVLIAAAFSYPSPSLSGLRTMLSKVGEPESGLVLMTACVLCVYGLGGMSLFSSRRGIVACASAISVPIVMGLCVWAYYSASVRVRASLSLSARPVEVQAQSREVDVDVDVTNEGTVPIYIENDVRQAVSRSQFVLDVQQNAAGEWLGGGVVFAPAEQNGKGSPTIAPNGTLRLAGRLSCGEAASNVLLRAVLSGQDDAKIFSNEARVVLPRPPRVPRGQLTKREDSMAAPPPVQLVAPDPALEEAHRKLEQLQQQLTQGKAGPALTSVRETREAIGRIEVASERDPLNRAVDTAILSAKVREASDIMRRADDAFKNETYNRAASLAQEALDVFAKEPLSPMADHVTASSATALHTDASNLIETAGRAGDPMARFTLTGIMQLANGHTGAFLNDSITGESLRVDEGDHLRQWVVEKISARTVVLRSGTQTWELSKK